MAQGGMAEQMPQFYFDFYHTCAYDKAPGQNFYIIVNLFPGIFSFYFYIDYKTTERKFFEILKLTPVLGSLNVGGVTGSCTLRR